MAHAVLYVIVAASGAFTGLTFADALLARLMDLFD